MVQKLVEFEKWCKTCINRDMPEEFPECWDCLTEPTNEDSRRPVNYKFDEKKAKEIEDENISR